MYTADYYMNIQYFIVNSCAGQPSFPINQSKASPSSSTRGRSSVTSNQTIVHASHSLTSGGKVAWRKFQTRQKTKQVNCWSAEWDCNEAPLPTARAPLTIYRGLPPDWLHSTLMLVCFLHCWDPSLLVLITSPPNATDERKVSVINRISINLND